VLELEDAFGQDRPVDRIHDPLLVIRVNVFVEPASAWLIGVRYEIPALEKTHLAPIRAHAIYDIGACSDECAKAIVFV
jgi:hypothetical protein